MAHPFTHRPWYWIVIAVAAAPACSRHTELGGDADAGIVVLAGPEPPAEIPEVEGSGITSAELPACAERPAGACVGANDFPCAFGEWVNATIGACQIEVDCRAKGWVGIGLNVEGCVDQVEMTDPDADFVACLVKELGAHSCIQCDGTHLISFLGSTDNQGCAFGCLDDFHCPAGYHCEGASCARNLQ